VVYRAKDSALDRWVAIKVLLLDGVGDADGARERFRVEARATGRLRHPSIVALHTVGTVRGQPYLVMDLVQGESLHARLKKGGPLDEREAASLAADLAGALFYAHKQGVLHRDVKPHNVLLDRDGTALLTDFGLAKVFGSDTGLTMTGEIMGTPVYMPPEQANADPLLIGPQSDVYSLGATLYAALTGQPPFRGSSLVAILSAVLEKTPPPPSQLRPGLDPGLEQIVLRCLAKAPQDRYPSAAALEGALRAWLGGARPAQPALPPSRRSRAGVLGAGLGVGLGVGLALGWGLGAGSRSAERAEPDPVEPTAASPEEPLTQVAPAVPMSSADQIASPDDPTPPSPGAEAERAERAATQRLERDPWSAAALEARGALRFENSLPGAEEDLDLALILEPGRRMARWTRAALRSARGRRREADEDLRVLLLDAETDPERASVLGAMGMNLDGMGHPARARVILERSLRAHVIPRNLGRHGLACLALGDYRAAQDSLTRALELEPNPVTRCYLAEALALGGDWRGAEEEVQRAAAEAGGLEPEMEYVRLLRLASTDPERRSIGARLDQEAPLFAAGCRTRRELQLAVERTARGEVEAALRGLEQLLAKDPENAAARLLRVELHVAFGGVSDQTRRDLELLLLEDPLDFEAWRLVGRYHSLCEDQERSLVALDRSLALEPENQWALVDRAVTRGQMDDLLGMHEDLSAAILLDPDTRAGYTAFLRRAEVALDQGRRGEARADFLEVIRRAPGSPEAITARQELQRMGDQR
jgi:tetratricopeptide (TPR) repeat protein